MGWLVLLFTKWDIVNSFYGYLIFSKTFSGFLKTFKTANFWRFRPSDDSPWELVSFFGKFKINTCQFLIFSGKSCGFGRLSKLWIWNNLDLRLLYKLIYDLLLFFGSLEWMTFDSKYSPKIWGVWWFKIILIIATWDLTMGLNTDRRSAFIFSEI